MIATVGRVRIRQDKGKRGITRGKIEERQG